MIDTHTHLYMADSFPDGGEAAIGRAVEAGVRMMVLPAVDRESVVPLLALNDLCPANTAVALGLHPTEVEEDWREELREILDRGSDREPVAIGETGIDLYWEKRYLRRQMDSFGEQIQIALDRGLPVIVHSRDAVDATIEMLRNFEGGLPKIVFHSFTGSREEAERLLEAAPDAFFGINGVVTFKNAAPLREAVEHIATERLLLETDSPFLAPVPFRGRTNESSYIPHILKAVAEIKGLPAGDLEILTDANAARLFPGLKLPSPGT